MPRSRNNLTVAKKLGLTVNGNVLKTGEYSGLGVYNPDPNNDIDPPTDFGLGASNTELLRAAKDLGVKYLHGNMSFTSHQPSCFNCSIVHPLEPGADGGAGLADQHRLLHAPPRTRRPTSTTRSTARTASSRTGRPTRPTRRSLSTRATRPSATWPPGRSTPTPSTSATCATTAAAGRWPPTGLDAVLAKYSSLLQGAGAEPQLADPRQVRHPPQRPLRRARRGGGRGLRHGRQHRHRHLPGFGCVTVSGARTTGFTTYGSEVSAPITLTANTPVTFTPSLLP